MRFMYCIFAVALLTQACKKDKNNDKVKACGIEDPVANIPWLKHAIDSFMTIKQGGDVRVLTYNGQDYINVQQIGLSCWACGLHTCDGRRLTFPGDSALIVQVSNVGYENSKLIVSFGY